MPYGNFEEVGVGWAPVTNAESNCFSVTFSVGGPEKGSVYLLEIDANEFADIALQMVKADPMQAVRAFGAALQKAEFARGREQT